MNGYEVLQRYCALVLMWLCDDSRRVNYQWRWMLRETKLVWQAKR